MLRPTESSSLSALRVRQTSNAPSTTRITPACTESPKDATRRERASRLALTRIATCPTRSSAARAPGGGRSVMRTAAFPRASPVSLSPRVREATVATQVTSPTHRQTRATPAVTSPRLVVNLRLVATSVLLASALVVACSSSSPSRAELAIGAACTSNEQCSVTYADHACLYRIAEGCTATRTCQAFGAHSFCSNPPIEGCTCPGGVTPVGAENCGLPAGFSWKPLMPCRPTAASDASSDARDDAQATGSGDAGDLTDASTDASDAGAD